LTALALFHKKNKTKVEIMVTTRKPIKRPMRKPKPSSFFTNETISPTTNITITIPEIKALQPKALGSLNFLPAFCSSSLVASQRSKSLVLAGCPKALAGAVEILVFIVFISFQEKNNPKIALIISFLVC